MAAKSGRKVRLFRGNGDSPEQFAGISGARVDELSANNELLDITDKDSSGWRKFLDGEIGVKTRSITVSGVLADSTLINDFEDGNQNSYQFRIEGIGTYEGQFMIQSMSITGNHDGVAEYSLTFESTGQVLFA